MRLFSLPWVYKLAGNRDLAFVGKGAMVSHIPAALDQIIHQGRAPSCFMTHLIFNGHLRGMDEANLPPSLMQFACLYNHHPHNLSGINNVLQALERTGIAYLLVCCRKGDAVYQALKKYSINTYGYYILTDFPVKREDSVVMNVRCL